MGTEKKLGFIGAGNMGEALFKGLLNTKAAKPGQILVSARRPERVQELVTAYGVRGGTNSEIARESDVVVLCVKPQILDQVLRGISPDVSRDKLIISVAAGVPIQAIERRLHPPMRIVRAMPNTPATVGAAATALALGEHATDVFQEPPGERGDESGLYQFVPDSEHNADYPLRMFELLTGLAEVEDRQASEIIDDILRHAGPPTNGPPRSPAESGQHPGMLKDGVTSPGGTAIAGLHTLEAGGLRNVLMNAVEAATRRSRELGEEFLRKL